MENKKKSPWGLWLLAVLVVGVTLAALPLVRYMMQPAFRQELSLWVEGAGLWGVAVLLLIQIAQVVVAVVPGEPVELVAGLMYGTLGGLFICMVGLLAGSAGIFWTVRRLGRERLAKTKIYPKLMAYDFLTNEDKLMAMVFLLYLIPGTPKDILVYVCALTTLSMRQFLVVSTLARIPSVITSTMAGASFASGNLLLTVAIFLFTGIAGILGILYHKKRFGSDKTPQKKE